MYLMTPAQDQINALEIVLTFLPEKDKTFAKSLIDGFSKYGTLSAKQTYWVGILLNRAVPGIAPESVPAKTDVIDIAAPLQKSGALSKLVEMVHAAATHLKAPKFKLQAAHGPVVVSLAGPNSKYPNTLVVTDGGPYGANKYYGRIGTDGSMMMSTYGVPADVLVVLQALAADPVAYIAESGKAIGKCVFCRLKLTDATSLQMGYGQKCASNYGLPWKAYKEVATADAEETGPGSL